MSAKQLAKRLAVSETGLSGDKIKGAIKLESYEWEQLEYKIKDRRPPSTLTTPPACP